MKHWVADQQDFFDRARNKRRQQLAIWRGLGLAVYFIAVPFQLHFPITEYC
jgi:hypothetical protein